MASRWPSNSRPLASPCSGPQQVAARLHDRFKLLTTRPANGIAAAPDAACDARLELRTAARDRGAGAAPPGGVRRRFSRSMRLIAVAGDCDAVAVTDDLANLVASRSSSPIFRPATAALSPAGHDARLRSRKAARARQNIGASRTPPRGILSRASSPRPRPRASLMPQADWLASMAGISTMSAPASIGHSPPTATRRPASALTAAAVPLWVQLSLLGECRERTELALAQPRRRRHGAQHGCACSFRRRLAGR